ncbi:dependent RNA helicase [Seminavis robusta]|uniref:Dependent RNA helicase n=1 Tax=Seminavis robusta TaxID=568900 RepID=A0A9N8EYI7_9STRA|nr:dependent RNA helicase [Seminavis robusta]|eukprot:Sro2415_g326850.1 dependent RNA helicase (631) ;mRNA; f:8340-10315
MHSSIPLGLLLLLLLHCCRETLSFGIARPLFQDRTRNYRLTAASAEDAVADDETSNNNDDDQPVYFQDLGLCRSAIDAIESQDRWYLPTPIQQLAIPKLLESHDEAFWCEAPTGSGKTAAFVLPLLQKLVQDRQDQRRIQKSDTAPPAIRSLILCPTRELALQIGSVVEELASYMMDPCNIMVVTGGVRRDDQIATLAGWTVQGESADIVVATPGRLVDLLTRYNPPTVADAATTTSNDDDNEDTMEDNDIRDAAEAALERRLLQALEASSKDSLSLEQIQTLKLDRHDDEGRQTLGNLLEGLQYLVIDEADRLLSRAFETEVNQVLDLCHGESTVETWLFSATFPKSIEPRVDTVLKRLGQTSTVQISCTNADRIMDDSVSATLQKKLERQLSKRKVLAQVGPESTIQLRTIRVDQRDRTSALKQLWKEKENDWTTGGVLVFVATRYAAEHVSRKLRRVGIRSSELHGKLDQEARERRLRDLQSGKIQVLLATDLASRGLDVVGLSAVINYDLPRSTADFVHRVGRTGRAGRKGDAISLVTPLTEAHYDVIEKRHIPLERRCEREMLPGFEVDEATWSVQAQGARMRTPGAGHSNNDLAHDRMFGGIKGKRKSKKDRLREKAAREAAGM